MTAWIVAANLRSMRHRRIFASAAIVIGLLAAAALMAVSFGIDRTVGRWERSGFWDKERALNYELLVEQFIPESGWWGHGPGTFQDVFDKRRQALGKTYGVWAQAHSDVLQTPVDYGWAGAAAWTLIIGGAIIAAARGARRRGRCPDDGEILSMACVFALAGVSLHALVDFPLQISSLQLYTMIIAGLAWGLNHEPHKETRKGKAERGAWSRQERDRRKACG